MWAYREIGGEKNVGILRDRRRKNVGILRDRRRERLGFWRFRRRENVGLWRGRVRRNECGLTERESYRGNLVLWRCTIGGEEE